MFEVFINAVSQTKIMRVVVTEKEVTKQYFIIRYSYVSWKPKESMKNTFQAKREFSKVAWPINQ